MSYAATTRIRQGVVALSGTVAAVGMIAAIPSAQAAGPARVSALCTSIQSGAIAGPLTVGATEKLCLRDANVSGAITVVPGGSLAIRRTTVVGAISLTGAQNFKFCGSTTVGGAISALDGVGLVFIGESNNCRDNNVDGAITTSGNLGNVTVERTTLSGALTVDGNTPRTGKAPKIIGNTVGGALSCAGNEPAPVNKGEPNSVTGARSGQCASPLF